MDKNSVWDIDESKVILDEKIIGSLLFNSIVSNNEDWTINYVKNNIGDTESIKKILNKIILNYKLPKNIIYYFAKGLREIYDSTDYVKDFIDHELKKEDNHLYYSVDHVQLTTIKFLPTEYFNQNSILNAYLFRLLKTIAVEELEQVWNQFDNNQKEIILNDTEIIKLFFSKDRLGTNPVTHTILEYIRDSFAHLNDKLKSEHYIYFWMESFNERLFNTHILKFIDLLDDNDKKLFVTSFFNTTTILEDKKNLIINYFDHFSEQDKSLILNNETVMKIVIKENPAFYQLLSDNMQNNPEMLSVFLNCVTEKRLFESIPLTKLEDFNFMLKLTEYNLTPEVFSLCPQKVFEDLNFTMSLFEQIAIKDSICYKKREVVFDKLPINMKLSLIENGLTMENYEVWPKILEKIFINFKIGNLELPKKNKHKI